MSSGKTKFTGLMLSTAISVVLVSTSHAATITYDEAVSGDIGNDFENPLQLDPDIRHVKGVSENRAPPGEPSLPSGYSDVFTFTGLESGIVTINVEASAVESFGGALGVDYIFADSFSSGLDLSFGAFELLDFGAVKVFSIVLDSGFDGGPLTIALNSSEEGSAFYSLEVSTSPIPVPGAALFLGTGLAGLAAAKRKKAKARLRRR